MNITYSVLFRAPRDPDGVWLAPSASSQNIAGVPNAPTPEDALLRMHTRWRGWPHGDSESAVALYRNGTLAQIIPMRIVSVQSARAERLGASAHPTQPNTFGATPKPSEGPK